MIDREILYRSSENLNELFAALAKAQSEFENAPRAGANPHFKSRYATLESVMDATKKGRENNGLAVIQMPGNSNGTNIAVTTILGHSSGQWIESTFAVAPTKFDAQGAGSVVTYLRRYALMSVLGIAPQDDDGEAAVAAPERPAAAPAYRPANPPPAAKDTTGRKLSELRDAIHKAVVGADSADRIDGILRVHFDDLNLIRAHSIPTYDRLIALAEARRQELTTAAARDARVPEEDQFTAMDHSR